MNLKTPNLKLELLNPELITLLTSPKEKFIFSEDTEVLVTVDLPSMMSIHMILKHANGTNSTMSMEPLPDLEVDTAHLFLD
jgi:hypothetical protein